MCIYIKYALRIQMPSTGKQLDMYIFKRMNAKTDLVLDHMEGHDEGHCPCFKDLGR